MTPKTDTIPSHGHGTGKAEAGRAPVIPLAGAQGRRARLCHRRARCKTLGPLGTTAAQPPTRAKLSGVPFPRAEGLPAGALSRACGSPFPGAWQSRSLRQRHSAAAFLTGSSAAPSAGLKEPSPCALPVPCSGQSPPAALSSFRQPRCCGDDFRGSPRQQRGVSVPSSPNTTLV